jgi:cell pole-organizing protein PopZ
MSDQNSQEPTMEEILASIRRIISEDDAPAPAPGAPAAVHEPEPAPPVSEPEPFASVEDDVLELTDRLDEPVQSVGDLDVFTATAPAPAAEPPVRAPAPHIEEETLVSPPAAGAAASAFGQLHRQVLMPAEGRSLEDVTRELLRPMLKAWLDEHLPGMVQAAVEAEVERISRQRR